MKSQNFKTFLMTSTVINTKYLFVLLLVCSFMFSCSSKKQLRPILEYEDEEINLLALITILKHEDFGLDNNFVIKSPAVYIDDCFVVNHNSLFEKQYEFDENKSLILMNSIGNIYVSDLGQIKTSEKGYNIEFSPVIYPHDLSFIIGQMKVEGKHLTFSLRKIGHDYYVEYINNYAKNDCY